MLFVNGYRMPLRVTRCSLSIQWAPIVLANPKIYRKKNNKINQKARVVNHEMKIYQLPTKVYGIIKKKYYSCEFV